MKIFIVLSVLAAMAVAEYCNHDSDCTETVCGTGYRVDCYRYGNSDQVCTCLPTSNGGDSDFKCSTADSCQNKYGSCRYGDHQWHCIDQKCRCSWFG